MHHQFTSIHFIDHININVILLCHNFLPLLMGNCLLLTIGFLELNKRRMPHHGLTTFSHYYSYLKAYMTSREKFPFIALKWTLTCVCALFAWPLVSKTGTLSLGLKLWKYHLLSSREKYPGQGCQTGKVYFGVIGYAVFQNKATETVHML